EFSTLAVNNRIHAELLRLAMSAGINDNVSEISPAPTHAEIASRISTHREAVTRELNELAQAGVLEKRNRALVVRDIAWLQDVVALKLGETPAPPG
ncbi:MAG: helix-turn-helix domain-containing protein, partial [Alphaproteobacteria bacterium]